MQRTMRLLLSILAIGLLGSGALFAQVTRGEIEAAFNAGATGGTVIFSNSEVAPVHAAAAQGTGGVIHPFMDGKSYNAEDWHVILSAVAIFGLDYPAVAPLFDLLETKMLLDGSEIALTQQPVKRDLWVQQFNPTIPGYSRTDGKIYSPAELAVGWHTLHTTIYYRGWVWADMEITFEIAN